MKACVAILFSALFLSICTSTNANTGQQAYTFKHWNTEAGLSQNTVESITQDSLGYLWLATSNGVNRFDGESFNFYPSTRVTNINVDFLGRVQASTSNGLIIYDRKIDQFFNLASIVKLDQGVDHIHDIGHDIHNRLWMCSTGGVFIFDPSDSTIQQLPVPDHLSEELLLGRNFHSTTGDSILLSTNHATFSINIHSLQIRQLFTMRSIAADEHAIDFSVDARGMIWAGTFYGVLYRYDPFSKVLTEIPVPETNLVNDIISESDSTILISFDYAGIFRYNINTYKTTYIFDNENDRKEIGTNKARTLYVDRQNILWFGHYQAGVSATNLTPSGFHTINTDESSDIVLPYPIVSAILKDADDNLWIGTDGGGIVRYSADGKNVSLYQKQDGIDHSLPDNAVLSIYQDFAGQIWIGSFRGGLTRYLPDIDGFTSFVHDDDPNSISVNDIRHIQQYSPDYIWIAAHSRGFSLLNKSTGKFRNFYQKPTDTITLINNWTYCSEQDYMGRIWIGTSRGVVYFSHTKDAVINPSLAYDSVPEFFNLTCNSIFSDSKDRLWFGTERGLYQYNFERKTFEAKGKPNGLGKVDISSIVEDDSGIFWISTGMGIYRYNPVDESEMRYTTREGLQGSEFVRNSVFQDKNGCIFFGGTEGITYFNPKDIAVNTVAPVIEITKIEVMGQEIPAEERNKQSIVLKHNRNFLSFKFIGLNFINFEQNGYKYMLEGLDSKWHVAGAERKAVYTSLPPGTYNFRVIGSNNDGFWNADGASFAVTILPPWWETLWFRIVAVLSSIFLIILIYVVKMREITAKKRLLEKEVAKRTKELREANLFLKEKSAIIGNQNKELVERNQQIREKNKLLTEKQEEIEAQHQHLLSQSEEILAINEELKDKNEQLADHEAELIEKNSQLHELVNTKDKMLSIIAHDLKNPMNTLIGFSSLLIGKVTEYPPEKVERFIGLINKAALNSYRLLENLLTWARSQTGNIHIDTQVHDMLPIVQENIDILNESASKKHIHLGMKTAVAENQVVAFIDKNTVSTIIRNIISNAIKFTPTEGKILLSLSAIEKRGLALVSICDNGVGMTPEQQSKLFKVEKNNSTMGTDNEHGTGLGLVICKEFAEKNNGFIEVNSIPNQGTCFDIYLPLYSEDS